MRKQIHLNLTAEHQNQRTMENLYFHIHDVFHLIENSVKLGQFSTVVFIEEEEFDLVKQHANALEYLGYRVEPLFQNKTLDGWKISW